MKNFIVTTALIALMTTSASATYYHEPDPEPPVVVVEPESPSSNSSNMTSAIIGILAIGAVLCLANDCLPQDTSECGVTDDSFNGGGKGNVNTSRTTEMFPPNVCGE